MGWINFESDANEPLQGIEGTQSHALLAPSLVFF